jgi:serine/threonine protein kinase
VIGGTAGYMAPELLDSSSPPEFSSDVYSFGVLTNEVVAEKEPYSDQYRNFAGRGPFGAANYAKLGNRPRIRLQNT